MDYALDPPTASLDRQDFRDRQQLHARSRMQAHQDTRRILRQVHQYGEPIRNRNEVGVIPTAGGPLHEDLPGVSHPQVDSAEDVRGRTIRSHPVRSASVPHPTRPETYGPVRRLAHRLWRPKPDASGIRTIRCQRSTNPGAETAGHQPTGPECQLVTLGSVQAWIPSRLV